MTGNRVNGMEHLSTQALLRYAGRFCRYILKIAKHLSGVPTRPRQNMNQDRQIKDLIAALDKGLHIAEADVQRAKQTAVEIKLACNAAHVFQTEYTAPSQTAIDLTVPLSDAMKLLTATTLDEKFLYASNAASTTITSLSGIIASTTGTCSLAKYPNTKEFLEVHNRPIQSLHESLTSQLNPIGPHLVTILNGAKASLDDTTNPLRSANVANGLRELLRELLEILAPDRELVKAKWFVPNGTSRNGVTRRHRLTFAIYGFVFMSSFPSKFVPIAESQMDEILDTLNDLSKYTHTTAKTLAASGFAEEQLYNRFLSQMADILGTINNARNLLSDELEMVLTDELSSLFVDYTFSSLDELSSHTRPEGADDISVKIVTITPNYIQFEGTGSVSCDMQFGSDGDCRRGDGLEWSTSFPFTFQGKASTETIKEIQIHPADVNVDTTAYYE
jgi:hypothetical protein